MLKNFLNKNKPFLLPYCLLGLTALIALVKHGKFDLQLLLNQYNNPFFDRFFAFFTHLGEAFSLLSVLLICLCISFKKTVQYVSSYALGGILILLGKHVFFNEVKRPGYFFNDNLNYHFVEGITLNMYNSFPSGHTQAGFTVFFFLCILLEKPSLKFLAFLFATLIAYSRVYLSQHFVSDILVGSLIAISACTFIDYLFKKWSWKVDSNLIRVLKVAIARRR